MLDFIESHPQLIGILLIALPLLFPRFWRMAGRWGRAFVSITSGEKKQDLILERLGTITSAISVNSGRLEVIEQEMKFNGGKTIKDMLYLMHSYRRHDYWRIGRPAMELDGDGQVTLVSEAACKLFGVVNPEDLKRRSWLRFLYAGTSDDVLRAYKETVLFQSEFSMMVRIHTSDGSARGQWEFRASPITREGAATKIYSCYLSPADEAASKVAAEIHWACHVAPDRREQVCCPVEDFQPPLP